METIQKTLTSAKTKAEDEYEEEEEEHNFINLCKTFNMCQ